MKYSRLKTVQKMTTETDAHLFFNIDDKAPLFFSLRVLRGHEGEDYNSRPAILYAVLGKGLMFYGVFSHYSDRGRWFPIAEGTYGEMKGLYKKISLNSVKNNKFKLDGKTFSVTPDDIVVE